MFLLVPPASAAPHAGVGFSVQLSSTPASGALPLGVNLTATTANGTGPYQYNWSFGDGAIASTSVPWATHVYTWISAFEANISVTDLLGEIATASVNVTVTPTALTLALVALPSSIPVDGSTVFEANATGGYPPYSYVWTGLPAGCVGTNVASLACHPSVGGGFTVDVRISDQKGGTLSASAALVVTGGTSSPPVQRIPSPASVAGSPYGDLLIAGIVIAAVIGGLAGVAYGLRRRRRT